MNSKGLNRLEKKERKKLERKFMGFSKDCIHIRKHVEEC